MTTARHAAPTRRRTPSSRHDQRRWRDWLSGLGALLLLLGFLVGIPGVLVGVAGIPLSHGLPSWAQLSAQLRGPDNGELLKDILLCLAWIGWGVFTLLAALETVALARQTVAPTFAGLSGVQPAVGRLVAAVALLLPATTALNLTGTGAAPRITVTAPLRPAATNGAPTTNVAVSLLPRPTPKIRPPTATSAATTVADVLPVYVVGTDHTGARDTLWSIAQRHLGNPLRWREIAQLNAGQPQPDGAVFTDPNLIRPGWRLRLPADATGLTAPAVAPRSPHRTPTKAPAHSPASRILEPPLTPVPPPEVAPSDPAPTTPGVTPSTSASPHHEPDPLPSTRSTDPKAPDDPGRGGSVPLGPGSEISLALAAAVLAAMNLKRLRRRRSYRPVPPRPARLDARRLPPPPLRELLRHTPPASESPSDNAGFLAAVTARRGWDLVAGDPVVAVDWTEAPILQLAGDGAVDVARALLAMAILDHPGTTDVLLVGTGLQDLFPGATASPHVRQLTSPAAAAEHVQLEVISRTRTLFDADVRDAATYRTLNPEDPFPALLVVLDQPPDTHPLLTRLLTDNTHLDIATLVLTADAAVHTAPSVLVLVSAEGRAVDVQPATSVPALTGRRMHRLTAADAATLLATALETETSDRTELTRPAQQPLQDATDVAEEVDWAAHTSVTEVEQRPPIRVQLLGHGPLRIWRQDEEIGNGLRGSARELLAWFLLHPQGRTIDAAVTAIWPDVSPDRGSERFWTALGNLRSRLAEPDGEKPALLVKTAGCYQPQPGQFTVDLWTFQGCLQRAADATDPAAKLAALREAIDCYRGPFAVDADFLWADLIREELHQHALDAHVAYAELITEAEGPHAAIATLERARQLDPDNEDLYRRLMRAHDDAGHKQAALAVWKQLNARLIELDVEPDPETRQLYRRIRTT